jgi:hypothetical protein
LSSAEAEAERLREAARSLREQAVPALRKEVAALRARVSEREREARTLERKIRTRERATDVDARREEFLASCPLGEILDRLLSPEGGGGGFGEGRGDGAPGDADSAAAAGQLRALLAPHLPAPPEAFLPLLDLWEELRRFAGAFARFDAGALAVRDDASLSEAQRNARWKSMRAAFTRRITAELLPPADDPGAEEAEAGAGGGAGPRANGGREADS